ncbi:unnamed protein product [Oppiella nova]|uniref:Ig-like domain-containing protein n=1 Tax=Oppiella nova TaxID=334625 RepID=A0A7R9QB05_9ACAR|nr:unnamed protein product [Oppiella nova]CAG2161623.1 unnamed protein product [Oppiella nova]
MSSALNLDLLLKVTWIRKRDGHILSIERIKYTTDPRFTPLFDGNHWVLRIKNISINDAGVYQCKLTSSKTRNFIENSTTIFRVNVFGNRDHSTKSELIDILNLLDMDSEEQNEKILEFLEKAEVIIKKAEDSTGTLQPEMIVNEFLSDPMPVKDFNISEDGGLTSFEGKLQNMTIHGLKQLKITNISVNLGLIQLKVQMDLPVISLQGIYDIDGRVTFFRIYGDGNFHMNITDIEINAYGSLEQTSDGRIQVGDIELDVETGNIEMEMENLMGGGVMGGISNSVVNQISSLIFNQLKDRMLEEVSTDVKRMINTQLMHMPMDFLNKKSSNVFDSILDSGIRAINESGLDPMPMPAFKDKFNYNLMVFNLNGEIKVFDGYLSGLTSLVRTGDIIATYSNNEVVFEASMGFTNLTGGYNWTTNLMGGGPSGSSSLTISGISCYLRLKQSLRKGAKPRISSFRIEKIKHLWIDVNGLGSWDFILEIIMNLVSNAFKLSLANAISGPVTDAIQKELNAIPISFL